VDLVRLGTQAKSPSPVSLPPRRPRQVYALRSADMGLGITELRICCFTSALPNWLDDGQAWIYSSSH